MWSWADRTGQDAPGLSMTPLHPRSSASGKTPRSRGKPLQNCAARKPNKARIAFRAQSLLLLSLLLSSTQNSSELCRTVPAQNAPEDGLLGRVVPLRIAAPVQCHGQPAAGRDQHRQDKEEEDRRAFHHSSPTRTVLAKCGRSMSAAIDWASCQGLYVYRPWGGRRPTLRVGD